MVATHSDYLDPARLTELNLMEPKMIREGAGPSVKTCFLCDSRDQVDLPYINFGLMRWPRRLAYRIPAALGKLLSRLSGKFDRSYRSIETANEYFATRMKIWCHACSTGTCDPPFSAALLSQYYERFYWSNRDIADGQHIAGDTRPSDKQLWWAESRLRWLAGEMGNCRSMIDFGAGDCAASFAVAEKYPLIKLQVVDPSLKARRLAEQFGFDWHADLVGTEPVDLIYSAHSIEHVHDLRQVLGDMIGKLNDGGYIFFETPNIPSLAVFANVLHTPHTFMLSEHSFAQLVRQFPLRILRVDFFGPAYQQNFPETASPEQTDLRVLLKKTG